MRLPLGTAHEHPLCARGQRRWAIVVPIIFLEFLVLSMSRTIIPELIDDQYGESSYVVYGSADGARGLLAFLATPAVGALSDELGRKWLFLVTVVGSSSPIIVLAFSSRLDAHLCVWALSGLFAATFPLAFAYISDHVPAPSLVQAYGITLGVGLGLALMLGPISGALLASLWGSRAVFQLSLLITLCNGGIAAVFMREESSARRRPLSDLLSRERHAPLLRRANPLAAFAMLAHHRPMRLLSALVFFFYIALWGFVANNLLYCKRRFDFTREMSAALLTSFGLVTVCTQSLGLRLLQRRLTEPQIVRFCFACAVLAFCLYGTASTAAPLYFAMVCLRPSNPSPSPGPDPSPGPSFGPGPEQVFLGLSIGGMAAISSLAAQVVIWGRYRGDVGEM